MKTYGYLNENSNQSDKVIDSPLKITKKAFKMSIKT
ncbi:hypothetical protein Flavo103_39430 [Flavobacterium collinsii]|nr:hypothetical protein Flavo103_39430 [Flavobacterium collinsii]